MAFGSLIAQLITIAIAPISTRLYTPKQLGIYTLILTISSLFGSVICGRYDLSIVSAENEDEVMALIIGSTFITLTFSFVITLGYVFYLSSNPQITNEVGVFAYLIIPILILTGIINILISYNNRNKEYETISNVYIIRTIIQSGFLVIFGLMKLGSIGLLLSGFLGTLFGIKKQSQNLYKNRLQLRNVKIDDIKKILVKYKNQPLYSMPAQFINSASYSTLNFFISGLFGLSIFGYYSMTYRILGLPLALISVNVSKVFFQRASQEKKEKGNYNKTLKQNTLLLMSISVPMVVLLMLFAPKMFELVFGNEWITSGVYVRILAPMYGFRLIVSALTPSLIVSGRQKLELRIQSLFLIISLVTYIVCSVFNYEVEIFLLIISICYSIIYILFYIIIFKLSKEVNLKPLY